MTCPNCGATDERGTFCSQCGAGLSGGCPGCGGELTPGARFCPHCGEAVGSGRGRAAPRSRPPWWIAVAAAIVVVLILLIPERAERAGPLPARQPMGETGAPGGAGGAGMGFSGDMRTDADRLFNRVMAAAEEGRQGEVDQFMPMALQAYQMVPDLDHDGLFHLAILYETAGDYALARSTAEQILRDVPDHILALGVAGTASAAEDDQGAAAGYFRRLLDGYDGESQRMRPEYMDHPVMVDEYRRIAQSFFPG